MNKNFVIKYLTVVNILFITSLSGLAQTLKPPVPFTHADTLRGYYGPSRDWWNVLKYDLHVRFNITDSTISGYNIIQFEKEL